MFRNRWLVFGFHLFALALALGGCGPKDSDDEASNPHPSTEEKPISVYLGSVASTDAVLGMVIQEDRIVVYVCGGSITYSTYTHWFKGTFDPTAAEKTFSLTAAGWTANGKQGANGWSGELLLPTGETLTWTVRPSVGRTLEGLYQVMDGSCRTGVVIQESEEPGTLMVQGTWCDGAGQFSQVTPVMPIAMTDRGIEVKVELREGLKSLFVLPMVPPQPAP